MVEASISLAFTYHGKEVHTSSVSVGGRPLSEAVAEAKQAAYVWSKQYAASHHLKEGEEVDMLEEVISDDDEEERQRILSDNKKGKDGQAGKGFKKSQATPTKGKSPAAKGRKAGVDTPAATPKADKGRPSVTASPATDAGGPAGDSINKIPATATKRVLRSAGQKRKADAAP